MDHHTCALRLRAWIERDYTKEGRAPAVDLGKFYKENNLTAHTLPDVPLWGESQAQEGQLIIKPYSFAPISMIFLFFNYFILTYFWYLNLSPHSILSL